MEQKPRKYKRDDIDHASMLLSSFRNQKLLLSKHLVNLPRSR